MSVSLTREVISLAFLVIQVFTLGCTRDLVLTKQGYVKGIRQDIQSNDGHAKTIYKFLGVPYAEKPIGDLRFKRPQTLKSWKLRIHNATYFRPVCLQDNEHYGTSIRAAWPGFNHEKDMNEDCLYLNIYTPSTTCRSTRKYPVMFYIHGGSYFAGTPIRDISPGEYLPIRDVVLVTIQYRLGAFGFFSTGDSEAPGNLGLLDQVEALKWIQQNIDGFCGDKNSVTLLGESAGGSSVSLHYLSPLSRGLFHRGIAVSGVEFSPFALKPKSTVIDASKALIKKLNCEKDDSKETLKCLHSFSSSEISKNVQNPYIMQPFVDQSFLPDEPKKLREEGKFQKLPLMSGFVSQEGSFLLKSKNITEYDTPGFKKYLNTFLETEHKHAKDNAPLAYRALEFQYTPWADVNNAHRNRKKLIDMLTDCYVVAPTHAALTYHSDHGAPTYMFEFAHRSQYHPKPAWMGVVHEDTTAYKFGLPFLDSANTQLKFDDVDKKVSDIVVTMFTNFAKFGNPTPSPVHGVSWPEFKSSTKAYVKIQKSPVMTSKYHPLRMAFWNSYFPSLLPKKTLPPSSGESKSSGAVAVRGLSLVFVGCIATVARILVCSG